MLLSYLHRLPPQRTRSSCTASRIRAWAPASNAYVLATAPATSAAECSPTAIKVAFKSISIQSSRLLFCFIVRLTCITAPCSQPRKIKSVLGISASAGKKCGRGYNRLSSANTPGWQLLQPIYQGVSPGLICDLASDISNTCCRFMKFDLKCRNWQSSSTLISASGSLRYRSFKYVKLSRVTAGQCDTAFLIMIGAEE